MKHFILLATFITALQSESKQQAVINADITGLQDGSKVYLVPNSYDTWRDSAIVKNNRFNFKVDVSKNKSVSIRLSRFYSPGKWCDFYISEGTLNITSQNGNFVDVKTSGSSYATDYNSYLTLLKSRDIAGKEYRNQIRSEEATKRNDTIAGMRLYQDRKKIDSMNLRLEKQWIAKHPSSPISSYLLYVMRQKLSIKDLEMILEKLSIPKEKDAYGDLLQKIVDASKATAIGKIAPDFIQNDTLGKAVSLKDFRGKFVLIDFWASWCVPCRAENPTLVKAFEKYKDRGFTVLSVSLDEEKDKWLQAIKKDGLTWTHISDLKFWDNAVARQYDVHSVPFNLLLDPEGKILAKNLRGDTMLKELETIVGH